ncbi:HupE/UreJ family protein [Rhodococcus sp. NCIMB 12038]|uniref:HupE/UreJ family protein n=1 Tax=Rhodococcus sp. NCIMB 12038 TaxID=933800 RepID=UPI0015C60F26|nr:HupE/UreJ family protein [Rhodococcus sp. NCIMB 12038]
MWPRAIAALWLAAVALLMLPGAAQAHEPSASLVTVAVTDNQVLLNIDVPLDRLELAVGTELTDDPQTAVATRTDDFRQMIADGVTVDAPDGTAFGTTIGALDVVDVDGVANLHTVVTALPAAGESADSFDIDYSIVTDRIYSHKVYVAEENSDGRMELLGLITHYQPELAVSVSDGTDPVSLGSMITVGFDHFREGTDHLFFLTLVVLTVCVRRLRPVAAARRIAALTVAFTVGHSLSLLLATLGWVALPGRLVETGIAVTIVAAAIHVMRPLVAPRLEVLITLGFGLVHGFGFAGTLNDLDLSGTQILLPTIGFNLGLELAQLAALALLAVPVWALSRREVHVRMLACGVGVLACGWIVERATGLPDPLEPVAAAVAATPELWALILLVCGVALLATLRHRHQYSQWVGSLPMMIRVGVANFVSRGLPDMTACGDILESTRSKGDVRSASALVVPSEPARENPEPTG